MYIQYQYARKDPAHLESGQGKIHLRLLDMRGDYWFAFFKGNVSDPIFVAKTEEKVKISTSGMPNNLHLALASSTDPSEMRITWKTSSEVHLPQVCHLYIQW